MEALLAEWSAGSGVAVEYAGAEKVPELLRAELEAGSVPDVIILPVPNWLHELAAAGAITPLGDEAAAAVRANFGAAWMELATHDGALYGVPLDANAKSLLWYRPAALALLDAPPDGLDTLTVADLEQWAAALEAEGEAAFVVPGGAGWILSDWFENVLLAEAGAEVYDALRQHRIPWTDPRVVAAAQQYVALLRDPWLMGGAAGAANTPLDVDTFYTAFNPADPQGTLWLSQGSIVDGYFAEKGLVPFQDLALFPFPADGAVIGVGSVAVATNDRPATMALLAHLAQPAAVEPWVRAGGFVSPSRALPLDAYPTALARREAELLVDARLFRYDLSDQLPPNLGGPYLWDQLRRMILEPKQVAAILAEIEVVATREQGAASGE